MYLLANEDIDVDCTAGEAFQVASNMERFVEWFPEVLHIESLNELPHGRVGKQYLETVAVPLGGTRRIRLSVTDAEPAAYFATEGAFPPLLPRMEIRLTPRGEDGCAVNWRMYSRNRSALARLIVLPLARRVMRARAARGLARLKQLLEEGRC